MTTLGRALDGASVTALLVSHDGERWLGAVLDGLTAQTRPVDRVVAVDTGSTDGSVALIRERLGVIDVIDDIDAMVGATVVDAPAGDGFGEAVARGLGTLPASRVGDGAADGADGAEDWVWLLHDDSAPAPDALERLLATAADQPSVSVLGPKLRGWPSLRRLLEVGVTISGTGQRETGLEPGEYDQGQHDRVRDVLAVNTAGMLVRRSVLESLGFDPRLPVLGADVDFGWRAARAGHRTVVAPDAVVFHREAAHRGFRGTPATGSRRRGERAAALYVLLVNGPAATLPVRAVRLFLGSLLRAAGLLLVRAPGAALDELVALGATYLRPLRIRSGRRVRRRSATVPHRDVRHLLAPGWLPYRHGLDAVGYLAAAVVSEAGERAAAHRPRPRPDVQASETGPVAPELQSLPSETGLPGRPVTSLGASPVGWVLAVLLVAAVAGARGLVGAGALSGGALLPAPASALDWWRTYLSAGHDLGTGSAAPAGPYLLPLAVVGTVLLGQAGLVVDLLFLLAVPLAAWGGYRFLLRVTSSRAVSGWGAAAYGLLPVVTGAVQQGRLGTVAATLVLPWLAHSAVFLGTGETADRRSRAAWRTGLWLAVLSAFVPVAWALAAVLGGVAVLAGRPSRDRVRLARSVLTVVGVALVLLLPWSVSTWAHRGVGSVLFEAGLPAPQLTGLLDPLDVVLGRPGGGAPAWMSAGVVVAAVAALLRSDTRPAVLRAWLVVVVALATTAVLAARPVSAGLGPATQPLWLGFPLVVAHAAGITAAALAGAGIRRRLTGASFGVRQPLGVLVVMLAALTPVVSAVWWVWSGSAGPLDRGRPTDIPAYMADAAAEDPTNGVLEIRGSSAGGFTYALLRQPGVRLGDDTVVASDAGQSRLTAYVADLVSSPEPSDVSALARSGVAYVYAPAPADLSLVGNMDSVSGVSPGSGSGRGDRAWQLEAPPGRDLHAPSDGTRPWLLACQGVAVLVALVLAAPTRRVRP